jgi:hypothetical protein
MGIGPVPFLLREEASTARGKVDVLKGHGLTSVLKNDAGAEFCNKGTASRGPHGQVFVRGVT